MIKKTDTGFDVIGACAVELDGHENFGLAGFAFNCCSAHGVVPFGGLDNANALKLHEEALSIARGDLAEEIMAGGMHGTTILAVRRGDTVCVGGDGQVSLDKTIVKGDARKVRRLAGGKVIAGFAGGTAIKMSACDCCG